MKRISFALLFGYLFGTVAFGQEPDDVVIQPLVDFDDILENIGSMLLGLLQQNLLFFLSLFFVWASVMYIKWSLQSSRERLKDERRIQERTRRSEERSIIRERSRTGRAAGRAMLAERMGWSRGGFERETERQLGGYSSDSEMRRILRRESENYGRDVQNIIDSSYVPSWKIKLREKLFEEDVRDHFRPKSRQEDVCDYFPPSRELDEWREEFARFGRAESFPGRSERSYPFSVRSGNSYRDSEDSERQRERFEEEYDYDDGFDRDYGNRRNTSGGY